LPPRGSGSAQRSLVVRESLRFANLDASVPLRVSTNREPDATYRGDREHIDAVVRASGRSAAHPSRSSMIREVPKRARGNRHATAARTNEPAVIGPDVLRDADAEPSRGSGFERELVAVGRHGSEEHRA
jgi:hypothetical protein